MKLAIGVDTGFWPPNISAIHPCACSWHHLAWAWRVQEVGGRQSRGTRPAVTELVNRGQQRALGLLWLILLPPGALSHLWDSQTLTYRYRSRSSFTLPTPRCKPAAGLGGRGISLSSLLPAPSTELSAPFLHCPHPHTHTGVTLLDNVLVHPRAQLRVCLLHSQSPEGGTRLQNVLGNMMNTSQGSKFTEQDSGSRAWSDIFRVQLLSVGVPTEVTMQGSLVSRI